MDGVDATPRSRPRLEDVAVEVGLSTASVSLVLRGAAGPSAATRQRVLEAAARLGYRPDRAASLLARRRSRLIGVMMDVRSSYHGELVEDVHEAAEQHGYDLVLSTVTRTRNEQRAVETLLDSRCEALVLLGAEAPAAWLTTLDRQLPVVVVGRPFPSAGVDVVRASDDVGVGAAVDHLVGLGHLDIAYVDGGRGTIATGRRRGYRMAMRRHGIADRIRVLPGSHTEEAGLRAAPKLMGGDAPVTAAVAFNDRVAVGLLDALNRAGISVPGQMSVIGYDDSPLSRLVHIGLTTVSQNSIQLTEHAVAAVVERLDGGRTDHREVVLPPQLVVRTTTAPPPPRRSTG
ncbi:MAG: transcriptional regulator, LacI family [Modestobacter sp.]|jgi:DNA-binding LacI/PurR family transcriptional regulator|nr:transcriptional regulator, LacI family [Modestobacter sp.]